VSGSDDLTFALALADLADELTMARFGAADLVVDTKPDMTPVSEADTAVERALRDQIAAQCPDDTVLGEEYGADEPPPSGRRWIIDPIDGTQSYVRGVPVWATLIALEAHGEPVVGVASAPALDRRWWAARGEGAQARHGDGPARSLAVSRIADLADAQACFGGLEEWERHGRLTNLQALSRQVWRTRGYGDFWQYMLVAEGAAEIATDPDVSVWDLSAPLVIVTEAGGRFTDFSDRQTASGRSGLATNGLLHEAARTILAGPAGDEAFDER
jgi:histidinol-phosphatase